jgi:hypothetical protein
LLMKTNYAYAIADFWRCKSTHFKLKNRVFQWNIVLITIS